MSKQTISTIFSFPVTLQLRSLFLWDVASHLRRMETSTAVLQKPKTYTLQILPTTSVKIFHKPSFNRSLIIQRASHSGLTSCQPHQFTWFPDWYYWQYENEWHKFDKSWLSGSNVITMEQAQINDLSYIQDRQWMYNVTLMCICVTTVPIGKQ
jgi:hypothetical protein